MKPTVQRHLFEHVLGAGDDDLVVSVLDGACDGGAPHRYSITHSGTAFISPVEINFQNGPIDDVGVNGVTHEALIAVIIDRLRMLQNGPYACRQRALALTRLEESLMWLHAHTHERRNRGVEGTRQL